VSYLALHIDVEFIVGVVCADNGTSFPITNGKEDLLLLYFFSDPHSNKITFGKDYKSHFNHGEINYYGSFFEKIEKEQETFTLRGIPHPVIDLLKDSGLLNLLRQTYQQKTLDSTENIPTLLTFSSSISNNAKQKTVDYLKKQGFQIDSYTIPLAELTTYYALINNQKALKAGNGSVVFFLEATNPTLHLIKLSLSDNYFLMDGKPQSHEGMGADPRKLALLRFVVNEANKSIAALFSENEKDEECKRWEMQADEWLKNLDASKGKLPYHIRIWFTKMPHNKKDVLVHNTDLDSDTGHYTHKLKDIFEAFRTDNVSGDVSAVCLLGDCFQSDRVKDCFEQMIDKDKLYFYPNKVIYDILTMYPKIDITRYASEEARIKERAKAEKLKQAEQRVLEGQQRREAEEEAKRQAETQQTEQNRKEAQKLFEKAIELDKEGNLQDAVVNVEDALLLVPDNAEYQHFLNTLKDKLSELKIKTDQYKSLLNKAENHVKNKDLESALIVYELAKETFDSAEIRNVILEIKGKIKKRKQQDEEIRCLLINAEVLANKNQLMEAQAKLNKILAIDVENTAAKNKLKDINLYIQEIEWQYRTLVREADRKLNSINFDMAENCYKDALKIKPNDEYCVKQLKLIEDKKHLEKENNSKKITFKYYDKLVRGVEEVKKIGNSGYIGYTGGKKALQKDISTDRKILYSERYYKWVSEFKPKYSYIANNWIPITEFIEMFDTDDFLGVRNKTMDVKNQSQKKLDENDFLGTKWKKVVKEDDDDDFLHPKNKRK